MKIEFDVNALPTPCHAVDEGLLIKNLEILKNVAHESGCKVLLAQKAFSMFYFYPLMGKYLSGTAASGLYEARLGREEMGGETHVFSAAYRDDEFGELLEICDHIIFNSFSQWERFRGKAMDSGKKFGIRVNPECSTQTHEIYDPCAPGSRLGVTAAAFRPEMLSGITGMHFHTLCEQNADALKKTLEAFEEKFGKYMCGMEWVNFGGGHHITRPDYDIETLVACVKRFKEKYGVQVYIEPGEAAALDAGYLVCSVLDIVDNGIKTAVLDASAVCHMPDIIEMPYRPEIIGAGFPGEKEFTYRLGGPTCLAGDIIGDYSFGEPLKPGDRLIFLDMAHYSMVKNNTFNGMRLPSIAAVSGKDIRIIRDFGYGDFKGRLS